MQYISHKDFFFLQLCSSYFFSHPKTIIDWNFIPWSVHSFCFHLLRRFQFHTMIIIMRKWQKSMRVLQLLEETNKRQATSSAVVAFFLVYLSPWSTVIKSLDSDTRTVISYWLPKSLRKSNNHSLISFYDWGVYLTFFEASKTHRVLDKFSHFSCN